MDESRRHAAVIPSGNRAAAAARLFPRPYNSRSKRATNSLSSLGLQSTEKLCSRTGVVIFPDEPVMELCTVSVAVIDCVGFVSSVTEKVPTPAAIYRMSVFRRHLRRQTHVNSRVAALLEC
jgi:hypothetical protein